MTAETSIAILAQTGFKGVPSFSDEPSPLSKHALAIRSAPWSPRRRGIGTLCDFRGSHVPRHSRGPCCRAPECSGSSRLGTGLGDTGTGFRGLGPRGLLRCYAPPRHPLHRSEHGQRPARRPPCEGPGQRVRCSHGRAQLPGDGPGLHHGHCKEQPGRVLLQALGSLRNHHLPLHLRQQLVRCLDPLEAFRDSCR